MNQDRRPDTGLDRLPGEVVDWLTKPFAAFLRIEAAGGAILLALTIAALRGAEYQDVRRPGCKSPATRLGRWKISPSGLTADPAIPIFTLLALRVSEC
jgi:hypothetical protein